MFIPISYHIPMEKKIKHIQVCLEILFILLSNRILIKRRKKNNEIPIMVFFRTFNFIVCRRLNSKNNLINFILWTVFIITIIIYDVENSMVFFIEHNSKKKKYFVFVVYVVRVLVFLVYTELLNSSCSTFLKTVELCLWVSLLPLVQFTFLHLKTKMFPFMKSRRNLKPLNFAKDWKITFV